MTEVLDVAIIGAGIAGITCAQQLHRAGYRVAIAEKSRGLGGRLAKRRLPNASAGPTHADHGVCYLSPKNDGFRRLLVQAQALGVLRVWATQLHQWTDSQGLTLSSSESARYVSADGISTLAKTLARDLTIHLNQRVVSVTPIREGWQLTTDQSWVLQAKQLVIAVPAPQAIALGEPLLQSDADCLAQLKSVQFSRCLAAIALYSEADQPQAQALSWQGIGCRDHPNLVWIGLDSSKQLQARQPVIVVQSSSTFAATVFETTDLTLAGEQLLGEAATLTEQPWIARPEAIQTHRWGYAFAQTPLTEPCLVARGVEAPLYFAGDWCGGDRVESAFLSGLATAQQLHRETTGQTLPDRVWQVLTSE